MTENMYAAGLQAARGEFAAADPETMALRSGARLEEGKLVLFYLGLRAEVQYPQGTVRVGGAEAARPDAMVILRYLARSDGLPPRGNWIAFRGLPGGGRTTTTPSSARPWIPWRRFSERPPGT